MPALSTLLPTGDSAVGSWTTDSGGTTNLWQKIEEGIAGATDTADYIKGPNDLDASDYKFALTDTPASFNSIKALSWQVRYALSGAPPASNKDTYGLSIRIVNGATILAAADSAGTFQVIVSTTTMSTSFTNSAVTAFTYVNTGASKATWDGAIVELRQTYTQLASKDVHAVEVSAIEFTGTYNAILTASAGSFSETGIAATLKATRLLTASVGALTETGNAATLVKGLRLTASVGSFAESGNSATLKAARIVTASVGSYVETGIAAGLRAARLLTLSTGSFAETGNSATLVHGFGVTASSGTVGITGIDAAVKASRQLTANQGAFNETGVSALLMTQRRLTVDAGSYLESGNDALLQAARVLPTSVGAFIETGETVSLLVSRSIFTSLGAFDQTGNAVDLRADRRVSVDVGDYQWVGNSADLIVQSAGHYVFPANAGAIIVTDVSASLMANRVLAGESGTVEQVGNDVGWKTDRAIVVSAGSVLVTGNAASLTTAGTGTNLNTQTGVFIVTGNNNWMAHRASLALTMTIDGDAPPASVQPENHRVSVAVKPGARTIGA